MLGLGVDEYFLNDVQKFIENEEFIQFMLTNTTDFRVVAFIMQATIDKINDLKKLAIEENKDGTIYE